MFRSLRHYNLRLFLGGQLCSLIGTWMQIVAGSWLVYRLTDSALILGAFAFALNFPALIFSPLAGVAADRFDRRSLLVLVNTLSMVQAFVLWVLVFTQNIQLWQIMVLTIFSGILNAYELPIRQSFISKMIDDPADLPNAVALNSSVFNGSRLIGPAIAGVTIAVLGEGACFLINALSFLPVIVALSLMRLPPVKNGGPAAHNEGLMEGFRYVAGSVPIRQLLIMVSILSMLSGAFHSLAPVFARDVFKGGPQFLGLLLSCSGLGAFLGAVYLANRKTVIGLSPVVSLAAGGSAVSLMVFAFLHNTHLAMLAVFASGLFMIMSIGGMNIMIQTLTEEEKRGRVMSLYGIALVGISPLGSVAAGAMTNAVGVSFAMFFVGFFSFLMSFFFWRNLPLFRSKVRTVYLAKGIIPEA